MDASSCSAPSPSSARSACRSPTRSASSAIVGAFWIDIPLEAVMLKISDGTDDFALLAIPFFVLAGAIMAEGGMAIAPGQPRARVRRLRSAAASRWSTSWRARCSAASPGSSVADTASIGSVMIPQMVKAGLSARLRHQRDHLRLGAGAADPALAQRGDLLDRGRRHDLGRVAVPRRRLAGPAVRPVPDRARALDLSHKRELPERRADPAGRGAEDRASRRCGGSAPSSSSWAASCPACSPPTESAAVACVYAFLVTMLIYRDYKWRDLPQLVHRVVKTVAMVMMLIGFSVAFGYMMALMQIPAKMTAFFLAHLGQQVRVPVPGQHPAAAARHVHGPGADAADLHADLPAGDRASSASTRCTSA